MQAVSTEFHGFDAGDCDELSKSMTVVTFKQGDQARATHALTTNSAPHQPKGDGPSASSPQILSKGEAATWVGVLLRGDVEARIAPGLTFGIHVGEFLGDMSLFEPNSGRGADVFASSDGIIGLFTFEGLEEFMEDNPLMGLKMIRAVGLSTVTKLLH